MLLKDRIAIVTGSSRGIGRAVALAFSEQGASLVINGTNPDRLAEVASRIEERGGRCIIVPGDVSDPKTAERLAAAALDTFQRLDILVNNAGITSRVPTLKMNLEKDWNRVLQVNLNGALYSCLAVLPQMQKQGYGKIINIASLAAKRPHRNASPSYGASKAALLYLTRHLAREMAPYGININALCPGAIDTEMTDNWGDTYRRTVIEGIPMGRLGTSEEMAQAVLFMASNMSDFMTGEAMSVNGGAYMD